MNTSPCFYTGRILMGLTVTKVVFELRIGCMKWFKEWWLTVTKVVFELQMTQGKSPEQLRLTVTKVVFEFLYVTEEIKASLKINSNKSCFWIHKNNIKIP